MRCGLIIATKSTVTPESRDLAMTDEKRFVPRPAATRYSLRVCSPSDCRGAVCPPSPAKVCERTRRNFCVRTPRGCGGNCTHRLSRRSNPAWHSHACTCSAHCEVQKAKFLKSFWGYFRIFFADKPRRLISLDLSENFPG